MGLAGWVGLGACIVAGSAATLSIARRMGVLAPTVVGMLAQGALTLGLFLAVGLWAPDAHAYDMLGSQFAAFWSGGPPPDAVGEGKEAFPIILGGVYWLVGHAPAIGLVINWLAHGFLVLTLAALARRLELPVRMTAWVAAVFPAGLFWSAFLLREVISWLLMALILLALVALAERVTWRYLALLAASTAALLWFRGTAAIVVAGVGAAVLVLTSRKSSFLPRVGVAAVVLAVFAPRLATLLVGYTSVADIEAKRSDLSNADTSFGGGPADPVADTAPAPTGVVDSALRVAFGPYPWEWPTIGLPFGFDAMMWIAVVLLAAVGWWCSSRRRDLLLVLLPALALSGALILTSGNYGTMQRLRAQTSVLILPVAAAGLTLLLAWLRRLRTGRDEGRTRSRTPASTR